MSEFVIVIPDLYLPPDSAEAVGSALTGLERIARFGRRRTLEAEGGWRPWLARALGRVDLADVPPAVIIAASVSQTSAPTAWLATPLHLIPSLTTVHLDRRSLLRLSAAEAEGFATDFKQTFGDPDPTSRLQLHPLASGEFLLEAPTSFEATTTEPARALVEGLEPSLPRGPRATTFKRLGAELEMWLHAHPLNEARRRRGELPVSTLWLWGGGPVTGPGVPSPAQVQTSSAQPAPQALAFGSDPYLVGLSTLSGVPIRTLPESLVVEATAASRVVLVSEVTPLLQANPQWTVIAAAADLDRRFLSPALAALNNGHFETLTLIANNLEIRLRRSDQLKFWRPRQSGLTGLRAVE